MSQEMFADEVIQEFLEEANEILETLNQSILELEKDGGNNTNVVNEIFRSAHTLKGMSGMMGFTNMNNLTHKMENVLDKVRQGEITLDSEDIDVIFSCLDHLNNMVVKITETKTDEGIEVDKTVSNLSAILAKSGGVQIEPKSSDASASQTATKLEGITGYGNPQSEHIKQMRNAFESGKKVYKIRFDFTKDFNKDIKQYETLKEKISLFGTIIGLFSEKNEISESDKEIVLNLFFISDDEKSVLEPIFDVDGSNITELDSAFFLDESENKKQQSKPEQKSDTQKKVSETKNEVKPAASSKSGANDIEASIKKNISTTVRVDIEKLDILMNLVGELLISKTQVEQIGINFEKGESVNKNISELKVITEQLGRVTNELQEAIMKTRMVPIGSVFNKFPRVVRDLARKNNKKVELIIKGEETELDKTVVEEIGDPMVHLIRNAVDHGIEKPDVRLSKGKDETGTLILNAYHEGNNIIIEIEEDGAGINPAIIKEKSLEKGIISKDEAEKISDAEIIKYIFKPGFSTAKEVTDISGRGVGMDVVKSNISKINGIVDIQTEVDKGTTFIIKLPLTLAIINSLLVNISGQTFAAPLSSVIESVKVSKKDIKCIEGKYEVINLRDSVIPVLRLDKQFKLETAAEKKDSVFLVILGVAEEKVAMVVDGLLGQREIVIKSLEHKIVNTPGIAGATILGDGSVVLILDIATIISRAK